MTYLQNTVRDLKKKRQNKYEIKVYDGKLNC